MHRMQGMQEGLTGDASGAPAPPFGRQGRQGMQGVPGIPSGCKDGLWGGSAPSCIPCLPKGLGGGSLPPCTGCTARPPRGCIPSRCNGCGGPCPHPGRVVGGSAPIPSNPPSHRTPTYAKQCPNRWTGRGSAPIPPNPQLAECVGCSMK